MRSLDVLFYHVLRRCGHPMVTVSDAVTVDQLSPFWGSLCTFVNEKSQHSLVRGVGKLLGIFDNISMKELIELLLTC